MRRIATIGDIHGSIDELKLLYSRLTHESLDGIYHNGDLVDRGPDSGAVVAFCREHKIFGPMGNHERDITSRILSILRGKPQKEKRVGDRPTDKERTMSQLGPLDLEYLRSLQKFHVLDDPGVILVHAGLFPSLPLWRQPETIVHLQMIHRHRFPDSRWWGYDEPHDCSEEENRARGWHRWYEVNDFPMTVVYGHSVYDEPLVVNNTIGIDTGCVYGGKLTAVILPDVKFVQVPAKQAYFVRDRRKA